MTKARIELMARVIDERHHRYVVAHTNRDPYNMWYWYKWARSVNRLSLSQQKLAFWYSDNGHKNPWLRPPIPERPSAFARVEL